MCRFGYVADLVHRFGVDGIPHLAFITDKAEALTALVGEVPKPLLDEQIQALIKGKELPYYGFDAFAGGSHLALPQTDSCPVPHSNSS